MVKTKVPINAVSDGTTLDIYRAPPMSDILYWLEQVNINLYGEVIVKTIAHILLMDQVYHLKIELQHGLRHMFCSMYNEHSGFLYFNLHYPLLMALYEE
jgi:hypothetical protein